ncbi:hypothetical protein J4206_03760 [Candidatus Woesearchaeota archaeon]|nr:hypothetical protein [Candidatus Woesearchaeota archaeon]
MTKKFTQNDENFYEALTELRKYDSLFEDLDEEQDDDLFDSYFNTNQAG